MWRIGLELGFNYFKAKNKSRFISFGAIISILGIALGVMVLVVVLSVMNGFDYEIHQKIFKYTRPLTIKGYQGELNNYLQLKEQLFKDEGLVSSPFLTGQGMLIKGKRYSGIMLQGIELNEPVPEVLRELQKRWDNFEGNQLFLGRETAARVGVQVGERVILVVPQLQSTPVGMVPRLCAFTVLGLFEEKMGNQMTAYLPLDTAQKLLQKEITGLNIFLPDFYQALPVSRTLAQKYGEKGYISTWAQEYGSFFQAVKMEKTTMFVILTFIITVASFNLVASLIVNLYEKRGEIALLRTIGADSLTIMQIFIVYGALIGGIGVLLGLGLGIPLVLNLSKIVQYLENILHVQFIQEGVYFLDYLPTQLLLKDLIWIGGIAFVMSILATLYPAWKATKIDPVEVLRNE